MDDGLYRKLVLINRNYCKLPNVAFFFKGVVSADDFLHDMYVQEGEGLNMETFSKLFTKYLYAHKQQYADRARIISLHDTHRGLFEPIVYKYCYTCGDAYPDSEFLSSGRAWTFGKECKRCANKRRAKNATVKGKTVGKRITEKSSQKKARTLLSDSYIRDILKKSGTKKEDITKEMVNLKRKQLYEKRKLRDEKKKECNIQSKK